jgi:hypothetical protein
VLVLVLVLVLVTDGWASHRRAGVSGVPLGERAYEASPGEGGAAAVRRNSTAGYRLASRDHHQPRLCGGLRPVNTR